MKFSTRAIHAGQEPDPTTGAVCTPIYQTSTYVQEGLNKHKGYEYARTHNPTREALEACLASMEEGKFGLCFGSGLAAEGCIMHLLSAGDHVICGDDVYGGTYRLFEKVWKRFGLTFTFVDASDAKKIEAAIQPNTKLIWVADTNQSPAQALRHQSDSRRGQGQGADHGCRQYFCQPLSANTPCPRCRYRGAFGDKISGWPQ